MATISIFLLVALASWTMVSGSSDVKCPELKADGCNCVQKSSLFPGPYVSCSQIKNEVDLREKIAALKDNTVDALQLDKISLPYLPRGGLFEGTNIPFLWLSNSDFKYIAPPDAKGPSPFVGLEDSLKEMKIEGMKDLVKVDWSELATLKKLIKISVYSSNMPMVDQSLAKLSQNLLGFVFKNNGVVNIAPGAFDLEHLVTLSLEKNQIDRLDRNIFGDKMRMSNLMLSSNQLKELSDDFLDNMTSVKFLDLSQNNLTRLPSSLRNNWAQFSSLYLAGNPLACDCNLLWFLRLAKSHRPRYSDLNYVRCGSPPRLARRDLLTLGEADLCPSDSNLS